MEQGLRKTQAAEPKEKKTQSRVEKTMPFPLIRLLRSFNEVSIVFVICFFFFFVNVSLVYCPVSWWWQQPLVRHEFRKRTYSSVSHELYF